MKDLSNGNTKILLLRRLSKRLRPKEAYGIE